MDGDGDRDIGRRRPDQYRAVHSQWMLPLREMKGQYTMSYLALVGERDKAIQERNQAIAERKAAVAERDLAILQRDSAIAERDGAIMERDEAIAALELGRANDVSRNAHHPNRNSSHGQASISGLADSPYDRMREVHIADAYPISSVPAVTVREYKVKRAKEGEHDAGSLKSSHRKSKRGENRSRVSSITKNEWKAQDLGLNQVAYDETSTTVPGCSCTGEFHHCYRWGSGGWQSSCCTTSVSIYPLPVLPNKRHARVGGRKMSGTVFARLLSKLAADGYDLSKPVDLKDHWAKHGTNRYITIK